MKVLVTGGGGFIGSHLVERLVSDGHSVAVVDREPRYRADGAHITVADLNSPGVAEAAVAGVDAVFHLAAKVGLGVDFLDAPEYVSDNERATAKLLAALTARSFRGRLVLASSMVVYGEGRYRCKSDGLIEPLPRSARDLDKGNFDPRCPACSNPVAWELVAEDAPIDPRSVYAATKAAQERLVELWVRDTGASGVALRYHNVYGPRLPLDTPYAGVAAIFRSALRSGQAPQVYEDGGQTRDFIHVRDVVAANVAALEADVPQGRSEAYNVCSGSPVTIGEMADTLAEAFGPTAPRPVVTGRWRTGDVRHVVASPHKARQHLRFIADIDMATGLAELVREPS